MRFSDIGVIRLICVIGISGVIGAIRFISVIGVTGVIGVITVIMLRIIMIIRPRVICYKALSAWSVRRL
jgi:hypothetical protein